MELVRPESIPLIDAYAFQNMNMSVQTLIYQAGAAVAGEILALPERGKVCILCGNGNNGADGYATALALDEQGIPCTAIDVFGNGQRSEGGRAVLAAYTERFGAPKRMEDFSAFADAAVLVDAIFGSGARFPLSEELCALARRINAHKGKKVAIDAPLGVDADFGETAEDVVCADMTVMLSMPKRGLYSYPAREYCGVLRYAPIGLNLPVFKERYTAAYATDADAVRTMLPVRGKNTHKGTFGKLFIFAGSRQYRGAPQLAAHAAARTGAGLITLVSERAVIDVLGRKLPELIYEEAPPISQWDAEKTEKYLRLTEGAQAVLVGPGSGVSEGLCRFVLRLLAKAGCPLILDADAITSLALQRDRAIEALRLAKRAVLLTPHPLELARLCGIGAGEIQAKRMRTALACAREWGIFLLLKGAGTLISDGERLFINTTGSSALAKGGSGDVLSGIVGAFAAQGCDPLYALASAAYLHGAAGDTLEGELSPYGVTPSDLPKQVAREIARLTKLKTNVNV